MFFYKYAKRRQRKILRKLVDRVGQASKLRHSGSVAQW